MGKCLQCSAEFCVSESHVEFYKMATPVVNSERFELPHPKLCPLCRAQRRYVWRGELHLFKRISDFSKKPIISFIPPESPCKVYDTQEWWSDNWDAKSYGLDFDFERPFFAQFKELLEQTPLLGRGTHNNEENTDYTNCASWNRNCYLLGGANYNEDCFYGNYVNRSKNCIDCNFIDTCELCYECVDCNNCYNLKYSYNCNNSSDSYFLSNCRNCKNCFNCVNLVEKEYYFDNKPLRPQEYRAKMAQIKLNSRKTINTLLERHRNFRIQFPHRYRIGDLNEESTGNSMRGCKSCTDCFDVSGLWDCHHCHWLHNAKNCMDVISWGFPAELCYECVEAGDGAYHNLFCVSCYGSAETLYSYYTVYSKNCFGCVSLKKSEYCILNKQYSKEEYEQLLPRVIRHMQKHREWGEFFPIKISPLCYNTSIAQDYFPLDQEAAEGLGWRWHQREETVLAHACGKVPDQIVFGAEDICGQIFECKETGRAFKIIKPELDFYSQNGIPLPELCFDARHKRRLEQRTPRQLWERECHQCEKTIETSYAPFRAEIVYCEECYRDALI